MKESYIVAYIVFIVVSLNIVAKDDDVSKQEETEAPKELLTKEARVNEAEAQLKETLKRFDEIATKEELEQLRDKHLETLAELESLVLVESPLVDLANAINAEDIVTPYKDLLTTMFDNFSGVFTNFSVHDLGVTLDLTPENRVLVKTIDPEGRFHITNLKPNDVITEINKELLVDQIDDPVETVRYFLFPYAKVLKGFPPIALTVNREGKSVDVEISNDDAALQTVKFKPTTLKAPNLQWIINSQSNSFTVPYSLNLPPSVFLMEIEEELGTYFDVEFGVLVLQAPKDSGFKAGDILVEIEDTAIRAIDHVVKALKHSESDEITTIVKRVGKSVEFKTERSSLIFRNAEEQMIH